MSKLERDQINLRYELAINAPDAFAHAVSAVTWTKDQAIEQLARISRSPDSTLKDKKDARHMILLLVGAIDGFTDQKGEDIVSPRAFAMLHGASPDVEEAQAAVEMKRLLSRWVQ